LTITGAGTLVIGATQAGSVNYLAATEVKQTITVNKAAQAIAFTTLKTPVAYGVAPIALAAKATSGLPVTFAVVSGPGKITGTTLTITGAGTLVIGAAQAGNANYTAATEAKQTITVNKAAFKVTANPLSMKQGAAVPTLTYSITGFVDGDTQAKATTGQPALSTTATSKSAAGSYPIAIKAGTLIASNYTFTFVNGTLTVTN
jgi:MBG domain (YGX type)